MRGKCALQKSRHVLNEFAFFVTDTYIAASKGTSFLCLILYKFIDIHWFFRVSEWNMASGRRLSAIEDQLRLKRLI